MATATAAAPVTDQLLDVPVDDIEVKDGFNPRTEIEQAELDDLIGSIRARGNTTPVVVRPNDEGAERPYLLIAGERRYRASVAADRKTVRAIVKPPNPDMADISIAMLENAYREGLNPVDEATGYARMLEEEPKTHGTRKGLAEFLGDPKKLRKRIAVRLDLLKLPEELLPHIASGEIALSAVAPLLRLQRIHPDLPALAVDRVLKRPAQQWMQDYTWADLVDDPVSVVCGQGEVDRRELPADVYVTNAHYPVDTFVLSDKVRKNLEAWAKVRECDWTEYNVYFGGEAFEEACALKAGFRCGESGFVNLVVGDDIANQLVENMIGRSVRQARKEARERAKAGEQPAATPARAAGQQAPAAVGDEQQPVDSKAERERLKRECEEAKERQRKAIAHNHELGRRCVEAFATIKIDLRVIRILANVNFNEIGKLAMRGARYGYPGWTEEVQINGGKGTKVTYVTEPVDAAEKVAAWLGHLKKHTDLAGRLVGLVVMARYADEAALPEDERSGFHLPIPATLGWQTTEMIDAIDELAAERLPAKLLKAKLAEYAERRRQIEELEKRVETTNDRLNRASELTDKERDQLRSDIDSTWRRADPHWSHAMRKLDAIERDLARDADPDDNGDPREVDAESDAPAPDTATPDSLDDAELIEA